MRTLPVRAPSAFTSFTAAAYSGLSSAGGGSLRNWPPLAMTQGVTSPHRGSSPGGVGPPGTVGTGRQRPTSRVGV